MYIVQNGNSYNSSQALTVMVNDESELSTIPDCAPGSIAYMNNQIDGAMSKTWVRDEQGNWNLTSGNGGSQGGYKHILHSTSPTSESFDASAYKDIVLVFSAQTTGASHNIRLSYGMSRLTLATLTPVNGVVEGYVHIIFTEGFMEISKVAVLSQKGDGSYKTYSPDPNVYKVPSFFWNVAQFTSSSTITDCTIDVYAK